MKCIRICAILIFVAGGAALTGCESSSYSARHDAGIDPISRNVDRTEGGAVNDRANTQAPPVRRDYVEDR